eukprot:10995513-Karenia_brevis.AAC.1
MKVLGCIVSANASFGDEVDNRVSLATKAFYSNQDQLMCKSVGIKVRVLLLFKVVGQVLLFGAETMTLTDA